MPATQLGVTVRIPCVCRVVAKAKSRIAARLPPPQFSRKVLRNKELRLGFFEDEKRDLDG